MVDGDQSYTVITQLRMADGTLANALFRGSSLGVTPQPEMLAFHGETGSLVMSGRLGMDERLQLFVKTLQSWEEVPIPSEIIAALPSSPDPVQGCWNQFFREFAAHVRGEAYTGYPTFHDGCTAVEVIEIARSGCSWTVLES